MSGAYPIPTPSSRGSQSLPLEPRRMDDPSCTFAGTLAMQSWADLQRWEQLLELLEEEHDYWRIVEIGTGPGGMEKFLYHQQEWRLWSYVTFDIERGFTRSSVVLDVYENPDEVRKHLTGHVILHLDGIDKPRELDLFATKLPTGSVCVVHDWNREGQAGSSDLPSNLRPAFEGLWRDDPGCYMGVFRAW